MVQIGGRVKSASVSFRILYDLAAPIIDDPNSPDAAFQTRQQFSAFRRNPPIGFRNAFFPQGPKEMDIAFAGAGLYRPVIKSDQGPAGNFIPFQISNGLSRMNGRLHKEEGIAVPELFLQQLFDNPVIPDTQRGLFYELIKQVQYEYQLADYDKAFSAILQIRALAESFGFTTTRRAGVGRNEFFFCRPVSTQEPLIVGRDLSESIEDKMKAVVKKISGLASLTRYFVQQGLDIQSAKRKALLLQDNVRDDNSKGTTHFQTDVLLRKDGSFEIERVHFPDVGMFLTQLDVDLSNKTFQTIKSINGKICNEVLASVSQMTGREVSLVTRHEVLENSEDTLEHLELQTFAEGLIDKGKVISIYSLNDIESIPNGTIIMLFNVLPSGQVYEDLLYRYAKGELQCYPDPFMKLFSEEATTLQRILIQDEDLTSFLELAQPVESNKPRTILQRMQAFQSFFGQLNINDDIIHFVIEGSSKYIPTFRYDIKSFTAVSKAITFARNEGLTVNSITAIPIPFSQNDAIIQGDDGPRYAAFRFMFVRK